MSNKNIGSSFDDFLAEDATLDEATAVAVKRAIAWRTEQEMKAKITEQDQPGVDYISECGGSVVEEVGCGVGGGLK